MLRLLSTFMAFAAMSTPSTAYAWTPAYECNNGTYQHWHSNTLVMRWAPASFDTPDKVATVVDGVDSWDAANVGMSLLSTGTSPMPLFSQEIRKGNGTNDVGIVTALTRPSTSDGVIAEVFPRGERCLGFQQVVEADIRRSATISHVPTSTYFDFTDYELAVPHGAPLEWTIRHEIGHVLGMYHVGGDGSAQHHTATMNPSPHGGSIIGEDYFTDIRPYDVSEDDRTYVRATWPSNGNQLLDFAVQSYVYDEDAHLPSECNKPIRPSPSTDATAAALQEGLAPGSCPLWNEMELQDPIRLLPGVDLQATFNLLTLGPGSRGVPHELYLTPVDGPNPPPSSKVTVAQFSAFLNPNTPYERDIVFTVPDIPPGVYYLKLKAHNPYSAAETNVENNEAFWNRQIEVVAVPSGCGGCASSSAGSTWQFLFFSAGVLLVGRRRGDVRRVLTNWDE